MLEFQCRRWEGRRRYTARGRYEARRRYGTRRYVAGVLEDRWRKEWRMRNKARRDISWGRCGTVGLHMVRGRYKSKGMYKSSRRCKTRGR